MPRIKLISHLQIRLQLYGCTNRPFYHIVVMPHKKPRQGRALEQLGTYDPIPNVNNEKLVALNIERIQHWIGKGAKMTRPIEQLLGLGGIFPIHPTSYLTALRNRNKLAEAAAIESKTEEATSTS